MKSLILGVILGGFTSWFITHVYYKKANKANEIEIDKLKKYINNIMKDTEKNILDKSLQYEVVDEWGN